MKKLIFGLCLVSSLNAFATQTPVAYPSDKRIKMVAYSENNVIPIEGAVFTTTQLQFGSDEYVLDVEGGDKEGWVVTYQKNIPNMLFIKPSVQDSQSNMTVVTNRHTYYFVVQSQPKSHATPTYALKFIYPEDERKRLNASLKHRKREQGSILSANKEPKRYNWNYAFHGDKTIMPTHVFDDGVFTYLELRPGQDVPAVFAVDNKKGEEALVNLNRQGNYVVIHRLAPQLTLRAGKNHVASIFNNHAIQTIKRG
jgi:type IV secretion system protein VirB9